MTTPHTDYLIVPAWSDQAGHCRIVARESDGNGGHDLQHYRAHPEQWKEAGLMNSQGRVVCLNAPAEVLQEFRDCEPLMAGTVIRWSAPPPVHSEQVSSAVSSATSAPSEEIEIFLHGMDEDDEGNQTFSDSDTPKSICVLVRKYVGDDVEVLHDEDFDNVSAAQKRVEELQAMYPNAGVEDVLSHSVTMAPPAP